MENNLRSLFQACSPLGGIAVAISIFLLSQTDIKPPPILVLLVGASAVLLLFTGLAAFREAVGREGVEAVPFTSFVVSLILLLMGYTWLLVWRVS